MSQHSYYYELKIAPSAHKEQFVDFLFALGVEGIEEQKNSLIVRSVEELELVEWGVKEFAEKLSRSFDAKIEVATCLKKKSNEDWIQKYKSSIKPVQIGNFYIHTSWQEAKKDALNVLVDPALAFGSGHHESTSGCLLMLEKYLKKDDTLLDVGCGSGILSIASIKLGAKVDCCDTDEQALQSTLKNMQLNSIICENSWIGSIRNRKKRYDVVVANIITDVLVSLQKDLIDSLKQDGILILSGILVHHEPRIYEVFSVMKNVQTLKDGEWCTIVFTKG